MTMPEAFDLHDRVALVTGAGSADGIGFACARLLGELGAAVAVTATTERVHERVAELRALDVRALGVVADLTDQVQVRRVVAEVAAGLGTPTVLVNNAGMTSVSDPTSGPESGRADSLTYAAWSADAHSQPGHRVPHHPGGPAGHGLARLGPGGDGRLGDRSGDGDAR